MGNSLTRTAPQSRARDLAILRGFGVFDFLRTYGGVPFQLGAHLRRLQRSADLIELACPWDLEALGEIVMETLRHNTYDESGIRLVVTGGDSPKGFMPGGRSRLLVMVTALQNLPAAAYQRGAAVATVEQYRHLPEAQTINYIPGIMAQRQAQRRVPDAIDAIYCSRRLGRRRDAQQYLHLQRRPLDQSRPGAAARHHPRRSHQTAGAGRAARIARPYAGRILHSRRDRLDIEHERNCAHRAGR